MLRTCTFAQGSPLRTICASLAVALLCSKGAPAQPATTQAPIAQGPAGKAPQGKDPSLPLVRSKLKNGLTVLIHEDHTLPLVAVSVWYHVGSLNEAKGRTGFAHLFEHMMFQGSKHVGDDMHFKYVQQAGGMLNGTTNTDRTNYFEVVPANFLSRILYLEADRMGYLLDTLSKDKLDNQRDVVRNERRQRYEIAPYGLARKYISEALYEKGHPYRHLTIGDHQDLEAASLEDVRAFFQRYYVPSNAALVLAGDVTPDEGLALVEKWFGTLPAKERPQAPTPPPLPTLDREKILVATDRVSLQRLYLTWHSPAAFQKGDAELQILASILGGKSGRLYKRLVYKDRIAQDVDVYQHSTLLSSRFTIQTTAKEGHNTDELKRAIDEELLRLRTEPPTDRELERAKNEWEAETLYDLESVGGFGGRAEKLQEYLMYTGDPDYLSKDLARFRAVSPEGVRQSLLSYLGPGRVALTILKGERQALQSSSDTVKGGF